jgi:hypothetical protein
MRQCHSEAAISGGLRRSHGASVTSISLTDSSDADAQDARRRLYPVSWEDDVSIYRKWHEKQFRRRDDGTYLMRPYSILPIVYEVDTATKERWARYLVGTWRYNLAIAAFGLIFLTWVHALEPHQKLWLLFAYVLGAIIEQIWLHNTILRNARRVPANRWTGPIIVDALTINSRRTWVVDSPVRDLYGLLHPSRSVRARRFTGIRRRRISTKRKQRLMLSRFACTSPSASLTRRVPSLSPLTRGEGHHSAFDGCHAS